MKFNFFSKNLPAFGLNIGDGSLKFMQLGKRSRNLYIKSYGEIILSKQVMTNDTITDIPVFSQLLRECLDKPIFGRLDSKYATINLPESKSFVRVIQIPIMSQAEAENAVPFEAESFIPIPIDQVYLDWQKIGEKGDKMSILLVASPKDFVDNYLQILIKCGIKPVALEVESQSCLRAAEPVASQETFLILDTHSSRSSLIMVEDGQLQFTSTIPIAGNSFTDNLARALGISGAKAEEIKKKIGLGNTPEYPNITTSMLPVLNNLCAEIKNIIKFHSEHSDQQVQKILLTGGSAKMKNLDIYLKEQLQAIGVTKVEMADPWTNLALLKNQPLDQSDILSYATAIGLAARGVDFEVL
jgi:type IV pilus assembly protein PilM